MEWISVKEKLPDTDGNYLCVRDGYFVDFSTIEVLYYAKNLYKVDKYRFDDKKGKDGFYGYDAEWGYSYFRTVTHWMPLPELPKGE